MFCFPNETPNSGSCGALWPGTRSFCRRAGQPDAAAFARQALAVLPEGDALSDNLRSVASLILGDTSRDSGNMEEAKLAYDEAMRIGRAAETRTYSFR